MILNYPHSTDFNAALESEYRIGTLYLDGLRQRSARRCRCCPQRQRAVAVFTVITRNAPYSKYAPDGAVRHRAIVLVRQRSESGDHGLPGGRG